MKRKEILLLLSCSLLWSLTGCYYDKADQVYPQNTCDTSNIRLSVELNDILAANCFRCHSSTNAPVNGGNFNLQDYNTLHGLSFNGILL
jgi:hypothetical protein